MGRAKAGRARADGLIRTLAVSLLAAIASGSQPMVWTPAVAQTIDPQPPAASISSDGQGAVGDEIDLGPDCMAPPRAIARAEDLMSGSLELSRHEPFALPEDPTWAEDPFNDRNWRFQFHSLRFTWDLFEAWATTEEPSYRDRALFLIRDWVRDNPPGAGRSDFSWNDHSTAWRTVVLACAAHVRPDADWIRTALRRHATMLADPAFYVHHGNHALNQSRGLLAAACVLGRRDWQRLAARRIATLLESSVDDQGVTNEQAVFYQLYNLEAYRAAADRLDACGATRPPALRRLERMTDLLTHATLPDGAYAAIGDTGHTRAAPIPGTTAEFAASGGRRGPRPTERFAIFRAGFAFGRTGWGERRAFEDEVVWTARFGPGRQFHGHLDHGSVTLYGHGRRLVDDPGLFTSNFNQWRAFAIGRSAHNVIAVDGLEYDASSRAPVEDVTTSAAHDDITIRDAGYTGVHLRRRIVFSRGLGWLLVDDRASSATSRTYRQLWHLLPETNPRHDRDVVRTRATGGNVAIIQLRSTEATTVVEGRRSPLQGWYSTGLNKREPAPTIVSRSSGPTARFVTLVVPLPYCNAAVRLSRVAVSGGGVRFDLSVAGLEERVVIAGRRVTITVGSGQPIQARPVSRRASGSASWPSSATSRDRLRSCLRQGFQGGKQTVHARIQLVGKDAAPPDDTRVIDDKEGPSAPA